MAEQPFFMQMLCPKKECRTPLVNGPSGAHCPRCEVPLGFGAPIATKRRREKPPVIRTVRLEPWPWGRIIAAAALAVFAIIYFATRRDDGDQRTSLADAGQTKAYILAFLQDGVLPQGVQLPEIYSNPRLIFEKQERAFTAATPLVRAYLALPVDTRIAILAQVTWDGDPGWVTAFLAEVVYFGASSEKNRVAAHGLKAAVHATGTRSAGVAEFLLRHMSSASPIESVRTDALEDADTYLRRIRAIGY